MVLNFSPIFIQIDVMIQYKLFSIKKIINKEEKIEGQGPNQGHCVEMIQATNQQTRYLNDMYIDSDTKKSTACPMEKQYIQIFVIIQQKYVTIKQNQAHNSIPDDRRQI